MPERKGGAGKCATCAHPDQATINADLVSSSLSLAKLAIKYGISESSLTRHKKAHISASYKAVTGVIISTRPARERLEEMIATCEGLLKTAQGMQDANGNFQTLPNVGQALAATRELRATIELLAKITGELDERPTTVINVLNTPAWVKARWIILEELTPYPDVRLRISNRLQALEGQPLELPASQDVDADRTTGGAGA